jgi:hypothetical protein
MVGRASRQGVSGRLAHELRDPTLLGRSSIELMHETFRMRMSESVGGVIELCDPAR